MLILSVNKPEQLNKKDFSALFICPGCQSSLVFEEYSAQCGHCGNVYERKGYYDLLLPDSLQESKLFVRRQYAKLAESLEANQLARFVTFLNWGFVPDDDAAVVQSRMMNNNALRLLAETIGDYRLDGAKLLDVGCGRGGSIKWIQQQYDPGFIVGLDITEPHIAFCQAANRHPNTCFAVGDAENLPFGKETFDTVLCLESSGAFVDMERFFDEVHRVLEPGGAFLYAGVLDADKFARCERYMADIGFDFIRKRDITSNVLRSCEQTALKMFQAYGEMEEEEQEALRETLAVPGSRLYNELEQGVKLYQILTLTKR